MPPPCSEQRCPRFIGQHSRASRKATRPTLLTESLDDNDETGDESEDHISPDAEKSEIRFTLGRRRDNDENSDGDKRNNRDDDRRGQGRGNGDDNRSRQNGRGDRPDDRGSRFEGGRDGRPPFFREEKDTRQRFGNNGNNRGGNGGGDDKEFSSGRGGNDGDKDGDNNKGNNGDGKGDNKDGGDGNGNGDGKGGGRGGRFRGGGGGKDRGGGGGGGGGGREGDSGNNPDTPDPGSGDSSSTSAPPPPPPPPTITDSSSVVETSATTAGLPTFTPPPEATTSSVPPVTPVPVQAEPPSSTISQITDLPATSVEPGSALETIQTSASLSATDITDSSTPAPTEINSTDDIRNGTGRHRGNGSFSNFKGKDGDRGLNRDTERILIAVGSIGGFIVFCFIAWIIYRTLKKSKQSDRKDDGKGFLSKLLPRRGKSTTSNTQASDNVPEPKEVLTDYDTNNNNSMEAVGYYNQGKLYSQTLDGTTYVPGVTLLNGGTIRQSLQGQQLPLASVPNQYTQANGQVIDESDVHPALRSQIPNSYFSQSEFTHGPPNAYNLVPRQAYRASQVSSLSSGFGDGDIIMPPPNVMAKPPAAQATDTNINIRPFSWMSRTTGLDRKRDTVSTMKSEGPPRFLPVDSWVDQQKERTERAGSREEVPMVPAQFVVMQQTGYS